jgi:hypothetical protein
VAGRGAAAPPDGIPFEELAQSWREANAVADVAPSRDPFKDFQPVLERAFSEFRIGVFDVRLGLTFLRDKDQAEQFRTVCLALIDLQTKWIERFSEAGSDKKQVVGDLVKLRKWLARARLGKRALSEPSRDLIEYFGGSEDERELAASISKAMISGNGLGFSVRRDRPAQVIFSPTRLDFIGLSSTIGWFDERWRGAYWVDGVRIWTEFYWNELQVIALQYPPVSPGEDLERYTSMDEREETGLLQHVVQRATHSLCWYAFARTLDPAFESGLAQDMVVAIYGENNTRSGGNGRGSQKEGWSQFVPGGLSQGGTLPKNNADSLWREDLGADHFVKVLRLSQRAGGKDARSAAEKLPHFQILHDDGAKRMNVRAPFLGLAARAKPLPPKEYQGDYREFFRAYKTCFAFWMYEHGAGPKKSESHAKFLQLLEQVAAGVPHDGDGEGAPGDAFEAQVSAVYGMPWSAEDPDPDNLEWRFLAWLAKQ